MKLLFICVAAAICFNQVCWALVERDETEQGVVAVVALVKEFLTSLRNGARIKTVELAAETIIDNVDAILGASETTVTVSDAQEVIDSVVGLIDGDVEKEDSTDALRVHLDREFTLLGALVAELENATGSRDEKDTLAILLAIRTTAENLLETDIETGNEVVVSYEPNTETDRTRRDVSKRRTCIGISWKNGRRCWPWGIGKRSQSSPTK